MTRGKVEISNGSILMGDAAGKGVEVPFEHQHPEIFSPFVVKSGPHGHAKLEVQCYEYEEDIGCHEVFLTMETYLETYIDAYSKVDLGICNNPRTGEFVGGKYAQAFLSIDTVSYTPHSSDYYGYSYIWAECVAHLSQTEFDIVNRSDEFYEASLEMNFDAVTGIIGITLTAEPATGSFIDLNGIYLWLDGTYWPPRFWGVLSAAPSADMIEGDMYYDSTTSKARFYTGAAWIDLN